MNFEELYRSLNDAQRQAVDTTEGPLLVIAGPGTGKTQLLAARVANILVRTDVDARSVLCLTYTDNAAEEMRTRLGNLIGAQATQLNIHTFHSFGSMIIAQYPEFFTDTDSSAQLQPLDDITAYAIVEQIIKGLPLRHPLATEAEPGRYASVKDVVHMISALKQSGSSCSDFQTVLSHNSSSFDDIERQTSTIFNVPRLSAKILPQVESLSKSFREYDQIIKPTSYKSLRGVLASSLEAAAEEARDSGKTSALGAWRDKYFLKGPDGYELKLKKTQKVFESVLPVWQKYQKLLNQKSLFDYDDMITRVCSAIRKHSSLRFSLRERFLYVLVDEYQDTNGAQNLLLELIGGVREGFEAPNVMAVGDDDQAIMRFQGAEMSNMIDFIRSYSPSIVSLRENYRSSPAILEAAYEVITQTEERLEISLSDLGVSKALLPKSDHAQTALGHNSYLTMEHEYGSVAQDIDRLIKQGVDPATIAVIAPKHALLEAVVPFLNKHEVPMAYERRENILEEPRIRQLITMMRASQFLADNKLALVEGKLPEILSFECWKIPAYTRLNLSLTAAANKTLWLSELIKSNDVRLSQIPRLLDSAARQATLGTFSSVLDVLVGNRQYEDGAVSPWKDHYFSNEHQKNNANDYLYLMASLHSLRNQLKNHFGHTRITLREAIQAIDLYLNSSIKLLVTHPLNTAPEAVSLLSVHAAKGREFDYVFMINCTDSSWGKSSRPRTITPPPNLPILPDQTTVSDRIRLFYVAMTRARHHLLISSHRVSSTGKNLRPASMLMLPSYSKADSWATAVTKDSPKIPESIDLLQTSWADAYNLPSLQMKDALRQVLKSYSLSPTHIKNFLDLRYGGPQHFLRSNLLRFPESKTFSSSFGSAIHFALERSLNAHKAKSGVVTKKNLLRWFEQFILGEDLDAEDLARARTHAENILPGFYEHEKKSFGQASQAEQMINAIINHDGQIKIRGKIDRIDQDAKYLTIIDYKTGRAPEPDWSPKGFAENKKIALHFNRLQLLFYKLLCDNSIMTMTRKPVMKTELVYVEPRQDTGSYVRLGIDEFDAAETDRLKLLVSAIYKHIKDYDMPDVSAYPPTLKGIIKFEEELIAGTLSSK